MVLLLNASNLEVLTNGAVITGFCAIWLLHIILLPFVLVQIKKRSKRARSTLKEEYAYFRHGVIYKSFLIGLNGKIPKTATVFSFVLNISLLILLPLTIWHLIAPHIILSNIIRIIYAYVGFLWLFGYRLWQIVNSSCNITKGAWSNPCSFCRVLGY